MVDLSKDNFENPHLEMIYGLDKETGEKRADDSITNDTLKIVLVGAGGMIGISI